MLIQLVTIHIKDGHDAEFLEAFRINYEGTRQEPGNIRFDVLRDQANPNTFVIYEVFASAEAVEAHRAPNTTRNACVASTQSRPPPHQAALRCGNGDF